MKIATGRMAAVAIWYTPFRLEKPFFELMVISRNSLPLQVDDDESGGNRDHREGLNTA